MLSELLTGTAYAFMLVFARIGTIFAVLPGFGEKYIPVPVRMSIALSITLLVLPTVINKVPPIPEEAIQLGLAFISEILLGAFIGGVGRLYFAAIHTAGTIISFMSGLGFAMAMDPGQGAQGAVVGAIFSITIITMVFVTDTHHMLIRAAVDSYELFDIAALPPIGDLANLEVQTVAEAFNLAFRLSTPFIMFGLLTYAAMGLMARMNPQIQVIFILMPAQIVAAFVLLGVVGAAIVYAFIEAFVDKYSSFVVF